MPFALTERDLQRLQGVHPDLVRVVKRASELSPIEFRVLEGLRTRERQAQLVKQGASHTMRSRHITGHAVDLAPYLDTDDDGDREVSWHWPHYHRLAPWIKRAAEQEGVRITWGGGWQTFPDAPHWELDRIAYPA